MPIVLISSGDGRQNYCLQLWRPPPVRGQKPLEVVSKTSCLQLIFLRRSPVASASRLAAASKTFCLQKQNSGSGSQLGGGSHWGRPYNSIYLQIIFCRRPPVASASRSAAASKTFCLQKKILAAEATRGGSHNILWPKKSSGGGRRWLRKKSGGEKISTVYQL